MKTVYIVRHAKSSWEYKGIEDIDRPLKKRGIRDSYLMASALKGKIEKPAVFITSSATRALSTAVIFSNVFGFPLSNLQIKKSLYNFSDGYLVKTIKALDDEFILPSFLATTMASMILSTNLEISSSPMSLPVG